MSQRSLLLVLILLSEAVAGNLAEEIQPASAATNETTVMCEVVQNGDLGILFSAERRLMDYLFGSKNDPKYASGVRPRRDSRQAVDVSIQFSLLSINSLDDKNQELSTTGYIMMEWTDEFLVWNPLHFDNLSNIVVQPELMWLPSDVGIENSVDAVYQSSFRTEFRAIVDYEGKVTWTPGGRISTSCKLDVTFYPYDYQSCVISLSSWAYSDRHVHLTTSADRIDLKDYNINGEWHIIETKARAGVRFYGEPYSYVMFEIAIQRKFYYHLINILLPCTLMSGLILLVFKLPAESGEKTGLGITILLSFSVFLLMIAESLPKTSDSLPIIGFYLTFLLVASSSSLLLTIISLRMHHATGEQLVPQSLRQTLRVFAILTCTKFPRFSHCTKHHKSVSALMDKNPIFSRRTAAIMGGAASPSENGTLNFDSNGYPSQQNRRKKSSSNRSPYLVNFDHTDPRLLGGAATESRRRLLHDAMLASQISSSLNQQQQQHTPVSSHPRASLLSRTSGDPLLDIARMREALAGYIDELAFKMKKAELEDEIKKDWRECSLCIDRIAFRVFSILVGAVSLTMCVLLPVIRELTVKNHW